MSAQFIFTMRKVSRFYPPDKEVLKDITLAFYPGAKIGVLGPNGAGKSSLLRLMAGVDDGYTGEARLSPGFSVGMLEQEPRLDAAKDVHGNVMDGVGQVAALLTEYDEVMAGWADPDADYEKLGARQADLESRIEAAGAWDLQRTTATPSRWPGSRGSCATTPARSWPSRTTATSSTTSPVGSSSSTVVAATRSRATTPAGSSRS